MVGLSIGNGRSDELLGFDTNLRREPACAQQGEDEQPCSVLEEDVVQRAEPQKYHRLMAATGPAPNGQQGSERRTEWKGIPPAGFLGCKVPR